ncbi:MAG: SspB family protein [Alphaproteobacteria bacterium]
MTDSRDHIDYSVLIDQAMRSVLRDVLVQAEKHGLPGEHHFYISFNTEFAGVEMSPQLKSKYPEEMTVVLQHQFWDFKVDQEKFRVTLSFSGTPEKLVIPFEAVTAFADPSVKFGLQFQHLDALDAELLGLDDDQLELMAAEKPLVDSGPAEVISLDAFRKK